MGLSLQKPVIGLFQFGCDIWNNIVGNAVIPLLSGNPKSFNPEAYGLIQSVNSVFVGVGSSLVVLFFLMGFCANSLDVKEDMRLENILRFFIKLSLAEFFVVNSLAIVEALFSSVTALIGLVAGNISSIGRMELGSTMEAAIKDAGLGWQAVMLMLSIFIVLAMVGGAFAILYQAYARFFRILLCAPYGALAFSTMGSGVHAISNVTPSFVKFLISSLLEAVTMMLSLALVSKITSSGVSSILCLTSIDSTGTTGCLLWMVESVFLILLTVGMVKGSQSLTSKVLGL